MAECRKVTCCGGDGEASQGAEFSNYTYSLVSGQTYSNEEMTFIIDCPPGYNCTGPRVIIVIPPGVITFTPVDFDPNDPTTPQSNTYTFSCGGHSLNVIVNGSAGFTQSQINQILAFFAQCQATNEGYDVLDPVPQNPTVQTMQICNDQQTVTHVCPSDGAVMTETTPAGRICVTLPTSATASTIATAKSTVNSQAFSQALAKAMSRCVPFLNQLQSVSCPTGEDENHTTVPIDGDGIYIINGVVYAAAGYYSSQESQEAANNLALTAAQTRFNTYVAANVIVCPESTGYAYTALVSNAGILQSATIGGFNFIAGLPTDGTLLPSPIQVNWVVYNAPPPDVGYSIVFSLDFTASAEISTYRFSVNNLALVPTTLSPNMVVEVSVNSVVQWTYNLRTTTGLQETDIAVNAGDAVSVVFAADGTNNSPSPDPSPYGTFQTIIGITPL